MTQNPYIRQTIKGALKPASDTWQEGYDARQPEIDKLIAERDAAIKEIGKLSRELGLAALEKPTDKKLRTLVSLSLLEFAGGYFGLKPNERVKWLETHIDELDRLYHPAPLNEEQVREKIAYKLATMVHHRYSDCTVAKMKADYPTAWQIFTEYADSILSLVGSRQEGRQEVIDWVNNHRGLWNQWTLWVAQLKEWGIKEGK